MADVVPPPVRILIVDEEHGLTDVVRRALALEGWVTEVASTGEAAFAAVAEFDPHIILLDMGLPDVNGTEVSSGLRAQGVATVPTTIAEELATNPFLRAESAAELGERRAAKDAFRG